MEEKTHATRCQSRRYAYLSHANAGIAAHPACWRPGSSAGMPDGVDRWDACGASGRYGSLCRAFRPYHNGFVNGAYRRQACRPDGRYDGAWRHDCGGMSHGSDRRIAGLIAFVFSDAVLGKSRAMPIGTSVCPIGGGVTSKRAWKNSQCKTGEVSTSFLPMTSISWAPFM